MPSPAGRPVATFRTLPYWESNEPFPLPAEAGVEPDPRKTRMDVAVQVTNVVMPHFPLMHEMTTDHVHEEIQLLANDFSTMLFETLAHVPRWRDYYMTHDQTSHYEHLRTQLKALQFLRGGRRWLLKSPQHLEQLPVLDRVFPGVFVIFTHRDPAPVTLSMLAMLTYTARMYCSPVPVKEIAANWIDRLAVMLGALVRDRDVIPPERSIDVRFDDFMADEPAVADAGVPPCRRAAGRRCAHGDRRLSGGPSAWQARDALRRRPGCSASTSVTCASLSLPTSRDSWRKAAWCRPRPPVCPPLSDYVADRRAIIKPTWR